MKGSALRAAVAMLGVLGIVGLSGCGEVEDESQYVIAGGSTTGVYYGYGQHLAQALTDELSASFLVAETEGSVDNLRRIGRGDALMGFAQSDAAADAIAGVGAFEQPVPIQAIARLYDEYVHVVVRADSEIERIADFTGRIVSLGARNSGVNVVARRVLDAAGVSPDAIEDRELALEASIDALRRGEIEGFFWVGGLPTPGLEQLAVELPIRLLSIEAETIDRVNAGHAGVYRLAEFPVSAYGNEGPTVTMTVPNYLVVIESVPSDLVQDMLTVMFEARSEIALFVPAAALLDRRQAIFTDPVELHPGAVTYYSQTRR